MGVAIDLGGGPQPGSRHTFAGPEVTIGSAAVCTLVLPGLAAHHCTLQVRPAGCFLVLVPGAETRVNRRVAPASTAVYASDRIDVGRYFFTVEFLATAPSLVEVELLAAVKSGDKGAHLVYADWLEECGDPRRAEFLRCQLSLDGLFPGAPDHAALGLRLRRLAVVIDRDWRVEVAIRHVEHID